MARQTQTIIFDCDGVLVDSEALVAEAFMATFRDREGYPIDEAWRQARVLGYRNSEILQLLAAEFGRAPAPDALAHYQNLFGQLAAVHLPTTPGLKTLLPELRQRGLNYAVATSGSREGTIKKLQLAGVSEFFPTILLATADDVQRGKPAPDVFLLAMTKAGEVNPQACVVVEDSPHGIQGAKAAGMFAVGFVGGSHVQAATHSHTLKQAGADVIIHHHDQLLEQLP